MKVVLLIFLLVSIGHSYYQGDCPCGDQHAFNHITYTCDKYPSTSQQGYVEGCNRYYLRGLNELQWVCMACEPSYNHQKGQCISNGIPGCIWADTLGNHAGSFVPKDKVSCRICDQSQQLYVYQHKCVKYPQQGQEGYIPHCTFYDSLRFCTDCEQGYYLFNRDCYKAEVNIPNCLNYGDAPKFGKDQDCLVCKKGFVLKNRTQCIKPEDAIENCEVASSDYVNIYCIRCIPGYFVNQNKCQANPTLSQEGNVDNCQSYTVSHTGKIICKLCKNYYALALDKSRCEKLQIQPIENCDEYQVQPNGKQVCGYCSRDSNAQRINYQTAECKKCPSIPQQQLNLEQYSQQINISFIEKSLEIFNKLYDQFV